MRPNSNDDRSLVPPGSPPPGLRPPGLPEDPRPGRSSVQMMRGVVALVLVAFVGFLGYLIAQRGSPASNATVTPQATVVGKALPAVDVPTVASGALVELAPVATTAPVGEAPAVAPAAPASQPAATLPGAPAGQPNALFAPGYTGNDGLPAYVCAARSSFAHFNLQMIQMSGADVANGFRLGIVPLALNADYALPTSEVARRVQSGEWDCALAGVDTNAELNIGAITALVAESSGDMGMVAVDGIFGYEDLGGKRLGYVAQTSGKYFTRYVLALLPDDVRGTVKLTEYPSPDSALAAFAAGELDAVTLDEPQLSAARLTRDNVILDTRQLRISADAVITGRASIANKPQLVQAFHNAWFQALKQQIEDVDGAADMVSRWGHNAWTGVEPTRDQSDIRFGVSAVAQATLLDNQRLADNALPVSGILTSARAFWEAELRAAGAAVPAGTPAIDDLLDFTFVRQAAQRSDLQSSATPVNSSFSLRGDASAVTGDPSSQPDTGDVVPVQTAASPVVATAAPELGTDEAATVAVLPCRKFTFLPNSSDLTDESKRLLDVCVVPTLQQRAGLFMQVRGSAAWPGPAGTFTENQIREFAVARAQSIVTYLVSRGIDARRFVVESAIPPAERREIEDPIEQSLDRWVEMTLLAGGR